MGVADRRANDNYGYVLAAQPGQSQGRPTTTAGSKPIMVVSACPTCVLPGTPDPVSRNVANRVPRHPLPLSWPYNEARPHRGLQLAPPVPRSITTLGTKVIRTDVLDGLIHEYEFAA